MIIKNLKISKAVNLLAFRTYHSFLSVFMMKSTPTGSKKALQKYRTRKSAKIFFFFLASFFFFRWASSNCVTLSQWFSHNSSMLHSPAHHFFTTLKSNKVVWTSYWRTMASLATPFSKINPCAQITEQQNNVESEIWLCAWRQGESLASIVNSVFEEPDQWFFSQYCVHLLWKPMTTDLLLCNRWQTSA